MSRLVCGSTAAHIFIPAFMSKHSAEAPDGVLLTNMLKSFFSCIPDNWCRCQIGNNYGVVRFSLDVLRVAFEITAILKVGGNTGKVNSCVGVDIASAKHPQVS
ncbi:hypothetical protein BDV93DRAFT_567323 [Ceratobasidium sp. AG-I]|nr:hypothetical protein BDV93DRAFT_567323 [Ceratobasidium sp. AG-I]